MRLTKIDELTRDDHFYLSPEDECWYFGEYTKGGGYQHSETNSFILNLKKGMHTKGTPQWHYKGEAILKAARLLSGAIGPTARARGVFVPVPPSAARGTAAYDDRISKVLAAVQPPIDWRELVEQTCTTDAAHTTTARPDPYDLVGIYAINEELAEPPPVRIFVVDDVLTTGAHFRAMESVLSARFGVPVSGVFLARRAINHGP